MPNSKSQRFIASLESKIQSVFGSPEKGFSLIELLIVIAILAILATIGYLAYGNIQSRARDAKRVDDIGSIALAIEGTKDAGTSNYTWNTALAGKEFPSGYAITPYKVPYGDSYGNVYCVAVGSSTAPPGVINGSGLWGSSCPGSGYTSINAAVSQGGILTNGVLSFTVCTYLENPYNGSNNFCLSSTTR